MAKIDTAQTIRRIKEEYADAYDTMAWLTPESADAASRVRENLITQILEHQGKGPEWRFAQTKLFSHGMSPGCSFCGNGDWSCLFINGICNARCFYCPSIQNRKGLPMTSSLEFKTPGDYVDYVRAFGIRAVSFSGGEPLMTFDRVVQYLKALRAKITDPLYIWMYTNGLLVTEDKLKILADNGLDEIRFDISADHYRLDALKKAKGIIPCVTVEIPAIPEDLDNTRQVIKQLYDEGVDFLNLHQLRCTRFNLPRLIKRGYTFVHGPKATVLETEITALELMRYALENHIALPINYCSFAFRHQFQRAGAFTRNALLIKSSYQDITATGHIRTMGITGEKPAIMAVHQHLLSQAKDTALWQLAKTGDQLFFSAVLWPCIDFSGLTLTVAYTATTLKSSVSFRHSFREICLNRKKKVVIEKYPAHPGIRLQGDRIQEFARRFIHPQAGSPADTVGEDPTDDLFAEIKGFERVKSGLAPYF
ncbi:MAG: radical SAM protein [Desulfotignum sp.]|nr:radical SAM protein [Desulfobacteraceae bacterium]